MNAVKDLLSDALNKAAEAAGVALGTLIGSPAFGAILGKILGKVLGWLLGKLVDWIKMLLNDDMFPAFVLPFKVSTPGIWPNGATHGSPHHCQVKGNNGRWKWSCCLSKA